jgi:hypothetical protein
MNGKMYLAPGHLRGESREEGQRRRHNENKTRTRAWILEIRKKEAARLIEAGKLVEEKIGSFEDVPFGKAKR